MGFRSSRRSALFYAGLASGLMLASCGGGGGSSAPLPSPAPAPAPTPTPTPNPPSPSGPVWSTAEEVFSAAPDSIWVFQGTDLRASAVFPSYRGTTRVASVATVAGRTLSLFSYDRLLNDPNHGSEWRFIGPDGVGTIPTNSSTVPGDLSGAQLELRSPIRRDDRYVTFETSVTATDYDSDGVRDREFLRLENVVSAIEPVSVPAGTVAEAARVDTIATASVTFSRSGQTVTATAVATQWYAKGLGVIKREFIDPNFQAPNNVVTEVLIGLETPSASAGLGREFRLFAPPSSEPAATAGVASDGTNLLVVSPKVTPPATYASQVIGRLFNPSGELLWEKTFLESTNTAHAFGSVEVAHDRGTYHVLAHRFSYQTNEHQLLRQRLTAAGAPLDGVEGILVDQGDYVDFVPARPRFNGPRVLYAWRRLNNLNGFDLGAHFVVLDAATLVPISTAKKAQQAQFVPLALSNLQRPGEFDLLSDRSYFGITASGDISNPGGTELIPLTGYSTFRAAAPYGANVLYAWVGDGSLPSDHLLFASVLFADAQSAALAPRNPTLIATGSRSEDLSIGWTALEATSTGVALAFVESRATGPSRLKFAWMSAPLSATGPPMVGTSFTLTRANEYDPQLPRLTAATDHVFVVKDSKPDPLSAYGYQTSAIIMRPPFAR